MTGYCSLSEALFANLKVTIKPNKINSFAGISRLEKGRLRVRLLGFFHGWD